MRRVIAVDLGGTNIRAAVVDAAGRVSLRLKTPNPRSGKKPILEAIAGLISRVREEARKKGIRIKGIALGCPGPVSAKTGVVYHAPNLPGWRHVPVKQFFQRRFKLPVLVENDANAYALGETWAGAGKGKKSSVCLTLGTGVGGGIVMDGKLWRGADDIAGEIGHMVTRENGEKCGCGNWGCLELYVSATGVARRMKKAVSSPGNAKYWKKELPFTSQNVFAAARNGNPLARRIARETSEILAAAVTSLVHILNPEIVIIGGGVSENADLLFPPLREAVKKRAFPQATRRLKIVPAKLGDDAGLIGSARAFFLAHP